MIPKDLFVSAIDSLRFQRDLDLKNSELISDMFGCENIDCYDNSILGKTILSLLRVYFKPDSEGNCEIEHYCYCLDFGKSGDEYESPQKLYDRLVSDSRKQVEVKCYNPPLKITPSAEEYIKNQKITQDKEWRRNMNLYR